MEDEDVILEGSPAPQTPPAPSVPDGFLAQTQVNSLLARQKADATRKENERLNARLQQLGYTGGLESLEEQHRQREVDERKALEDKSDWEELRRREAESHRKQVEDLQAKNVSLENQRQQERLQNTLTKACKDSVNPGHMALIIGQNVRVDPDGSQYVVNEFGDVLLDESGSRLSVEAHAKRFLAKNPYFANAVGGKGTEGRAIGNNPVPPSQEDSVDITKALNDSSYLNEVINAATTGG